MEINLNKTVKQLIIMFLLILLPIITIIAGLLADIKIAWFFILAITWFGCGVIFFTAIND